MAGTTVYVLLELEARSEFPAIVLGVFSSHDALERRRLARVAELQAQRPGIVIWSEGDDDDPDWEVEFVEEQAVLDGVV